MEIVKLEQEIVPELKEILDRRFIILQKIKYDGPIGRRMLASNLDFGERVIRNEVNILRDLELININRDGVSITENGDSILEYLQSYIHESKGLSKLESTIKLGLSIKDVYIIPGDVADSQFIIKEVARFAANYLKSIIVDGKTIAITGGNTMFEVVSAYKSNKVHKNVMVVPARGGVGRRVETQASTLAAKLASKLGGAYKLLHVPDNLKQTAIDALMEDNNLSHLVRQIKGADILLYGIGEAYQMVYERGVSEDLIESIIENGAVGEALGNYYDINGNIIYHHTTIGINDDDCNKISYAVAVACGVNKAKAITGAMRNKSNSILITDENTALEICSLLEK